MGDLRMTQGTYMLDQKFKLKQIASEYAAKQALIIKTLGEGAAVNY